MIGHIIVCYAGRRYGGRGKDMVILKAGGTRYRLSLGLYGGPVRVN